jgi:hypothetical protein
LTGPAWLAGGTAGPEASFLDFLILLSFFYVFHRLFPFGSKDRPILDETNTIGVSAP